MNLLEVRLEKLLSVLGTDVETGLTAEQVQRNRKEFGENILFEKKNTVVGLLKKIFGDAVMILFLLFCFFDYLDHQNPTSLVVLILVSLFYAGFVLFAHVYVSSTRRTIDHYSRARYTVRRSGRVVSVEKSELVPGDVLLLKKGDVMPCDGIILDHKAFKLLEASVTGRRVPVFKRTHREIEQSDGAMPYFDCLLFAGSVVLHGSAVVFVCNTGKNIFDNENFTISRQNTTVPRIYETAMELKKQIYLIWVLLCFVLFAWGVFRGLDAFGTFHYVTGLIIAAFPDSIEILSDLSIAYMSRKLYLSGVILRNPGSVDRLCDVNCVFVNSADYLFHSSPIAGKYTLGDEVYDFKEHPIPAAPLLENLILAQNSAQYYKGKREEWNAEKAFLAAAASLGIQKRRLDREYLHITTYDFDPRLGYTCALVLKGETYRLIIRGTPSSVVSCCSSVQKGDRILPMSEAYRISVRADARFLAGTSERIEAVAVLELSSPSTGDQRKLCRNMTYLGLVGLSTPISAAAANSINICQKSGIQTFLMTDDFPETVSALSKSVSIIGEGDYQSALSFQNYERMDQGIFVADLEKYKAYCGFPVEEKQSIVKFHKDNGSLTLSLTDGLYHTLPQMESDVSFVGAEEKVNAVRLNADILLKKKNYELIPLCINWARIFYRTIVHVMQYVLLNQVSLGMTALIAFSLSCRVPFSMLSMLLAGLCAFFPAAVNVYHRKPGLRLEDNINVLKDDRVRSLREIIVIPMLAGTVRSICVMLSSRIALYASGSEDAASSAALITLIFGAYWESLSMKFDTSLLRHFKDLGKPEVYSFFAAVFTSYLVTASPATLLWQKSAVFLRFWPLFFAILLSFVSVGILEWMKKMKEESPSVQISRREERSSL